MNYITINFKNYKVKRFPKIKIHIDGDQVEEVHFEKEQQDVKIPIALMDGKHTLEIEHFDKTSRDTLVRDNEIIADTKFTITSIEIDTYKIPITMLYSCIFKPDWINLHKPKNFPEVLKQSFTVGPNGIWSLNFETPVDDWIINWRRNSIKKIREQSKNIVSYESYEISPHSDVSYFLQDKDIKLIKEIKELLNE